MRNDYDDSRNENESGYISEHAGEHTGSDHAERDPSADCPIGAVIRAARNVIEGAGYGEVRIEVEGDDDSDLRMTLNDALCERGMLPELVTMGQKVYQRACLGAESDYPFALRPERDSLLGQRVVWATDKSHAHLGLGVACIMEALDSILATQQRSIKALFEGDDDERVLTVGVGAAYDGEFAL